MTTDEIRDYIDAAISANFDGYKSQSGEIDTSEGGDGRFVGKVAATLYAGLPVGRDIFVAIGSTAEGAQIVKVGRSEVVKPDTENLDLILKKELGIDKGEDEEST